MRYLFFCFLLSSAIFTSTAQEKKLSIALKNVSLTSFLDQIENTFGIKFSYSDALISNEKVSLEIKDKTLVEIINLLNKKSDLRFEFISEKNIIIRKEKDLFVLDSTQLLNEIILKNYLTKGFYKQKDGSYIITPSKIGILPGITEPDLFQSLQLLPGVISLEETATDIHVRGGSPDQNLILWDGIKIYHSGHLFGSISAFNPYLVQNTQFINKGSNARYGDRVSSTIKIQTPNRVAKKMSGGFGFNLLEADVFIEAPIIANKFSILFSVRRSLTDIFDSHTYERFSEKIFQNSVPDDIIYDENRLHFFDYTIKANWKLSQKDYVNMSFLYIENELQTSYLNTDTDVESNDELETENIGYNLNWERYWSSNISHQINVYSSNYQLHYTEKDNLGNLFKKTNTVADIGINLHVDYHIANNKNLSFGYQFSNNQIKYNVNANKEVNFDSNNILNSHSLYSTYTYKNEKLFDITTGIRLNYYENINNFMVEPRLNLDKKLSSHINLNITVEKKTQAVSQINETIEDNFLLEDQIWFIANNDQIPIIESLQFTGGFSYSKNNWNIDIDAYFKSVNGLTALNKGFIDTSHFGFSEGESNIKGVDLYVKKQFNNYNTWISYTLGTINNHFEGIINDSTFPANTDVRNNLNWSHEYLYKKFKFSLAWRWHTGKPYSKAIAIDQDQDGNNFMIYDGINAYRLPNYNRFDFSSTYKFNFSKTIKGKIGFSVLNILDNNNILNRSFLINEPNQEINMIDTHSLQRVANIVFRISW